MEKIKKLIKKTFSILPKKYILFESVPECSDNTKAVFDEMLSRGLNKKYKFVWRLYNAEASDFPVMDNVKYVKMSNPRRYICFSKALISCNLFLPVMNNKQTSFYLGHGNPIKSTKGYYETPDGIDWVICSAQGMADIRHEFYGIENERLVSLGYPRNDVFSEPPIDLHPFFKTDFKKIIVWYPTFRQHKTGLKTGSEHALPVLWDGEKAEALNEHAREKGVLIVLKPHFAQDVSEIKKLALSNIVFIDDRFFIDNGLTSYRFVGSCDALLSDYSSIYYDFTLCDKPIGLIWEDYAEYSKKPGFAVDMEKMMKGGVKIYTLDELKDFVTDVADGVDRLAAERREIRDLANLSTDGKNAKRVVDFIVEKAGL